MTLKKKSNKSITRQILTLKKDTSVICGVKLWAPFHPHNANDLSQKLCNCSRNGPVGHAYKIYSLVDVSSNVGSFTCANNQSEANWTPRFPVAAKAFSLRTWNVTIISLKTKSLTLYVSETPFGAKSAKELNVVLIS